VTFTKAIGLSLLGLLMQPPPLRLVVATGDPMQFQVEEQRGLCVERWAPARVKRFKVSRSSDKEVMWEIVPDDSDSKRAVGWIVYGVEPDGWSTTIGPQPLVEGIRYIADGSGTADRGRRVEFTLP
jgi:hypothetical protein